MIAIKSFAGLGGYLGTGTELGVRLVSHTLSIGPVRVPGSALRTSVLVMVPTSPGGGRDDDHE